MTMLLRLAVLICLVFITAGCSADDPTRPNTFIPLTSIEITAEYASMADQTVNQYKAIGDYSGVFTDDITAKVSWRIDDKKNEIAVVSDVGTKGLVTALLPGETTVTARFGDFSASAPVVVTNAFLIGIEIAPQDEELMIDITHQYNAEGTFSDGSTQDIKTLVSWESSDEAVATIDETGLVETKEAGVSTISAAWQGIESSTGLLVASATLTAINVLPEEATIAQGTTAQFEAEGTLSDNTTLEDIADIVDWQSLDTGIGNVNASGLAEGVTPGETEIIATFGADGDAISATAVLTVTDAVIEAISITPDDTIIKVGENQQFTATGTFSDESEQDITDLANWFTIDNAVGTISNSSDSKGLFTSIDSGNTIIEATFGGVSGDTLLTVE